MDSKKVWKCNRDAARFLVVILATLTCRLMHSKNKLAQSLLDYAKNLAFGLDHLGCPQDPQAPLTMPRDIKRIFDSLPLVCFECSRRLRVNWQALVKTPTSRNEQGGSSGTSETTTASVTTSTFAPAFSPVYRDVIGKYFTILYRRRLKESLSEAETPIDSQDPEENNNLDEKGKELSFSFSILDQVFATDHHCQHNLCFREDDENKEMDKETQPPPHGSEEENKEEINQNEEVYRTLDIIKQQLPDLFEDAPEVKEVDEQAQPLPQGSQENNQEGMNQNEEVYRTLDIIKQQLPDLFEDEPEVQDVDEQAQPLPQGSQENNQEGMNQNEDVYRTLDIIKQQLPDLFEDEPEVQEVDEQAQPLPHGSQKDNQEGMDQTEDVYCDLYIMEQELPDLCEDASEVKEVDDQTQPLPHGSQKGNQEGMNQTENVYHYLDKIIRHLPELWEERRGGKEKVKRAKSEPHGSQEGNEEQMIQNNSEIQQAPDFPEVTHISGTLFTVKSNNEFLKTYTCLRLEESASQYTLLEELPFATEIVSPPTLCDRGITVRPDLTDSNEDVTTSETPSAITGSSGDLQQDAEDPVGQETTDNEDDTAMFTEE